MSTLAAVLLATVILASPVAAQDQIRAYVFTQPTVGGFSDMESQRRVDAVTAAVKRLQKQKAIRLVDNPEAAEVVVEVLKVLDEASGTTTGAVIAPGMAVSRRAKDEYRVVARISAGDYAAEILTQDRRLQTAGRLVGDELSDWVKTNRAKVIARRPR